MSEIDRLAWGWMRQDDLPAVSAFARLCAAGFTAAEADAAIARVRLGGEMPSGTCRPAELGGAESASSRSQPVAGEGLLLCALAPAADVDLGELVRRFVAEGRTLGFIVTRLTPRGFGLAEIVAAVDGARS